MRSPRRRRHHPPPSALDISAPSSLPHRRYVRRLFLDSRIADLAFAARSDGLLIDFLEGGGSKVFPSPFPSSKKKGSLLTPSFRLKPSNGSDRICTFSLGILLWSSISCLFSRVPNYPPHTVPGDRQGFVAFRSVLDSEQAERRRSHRKCSLRKCRFLIRLAISFLIWFLLDTQYGLVFLEEESKPCLQNSISLMRYMPILVLGSLILVSKRGKCYQTSTVLGQKPFLCIEMQEPQHVG